MTLSLHNKTPVAVTSRSFSRNPVLRDELLRHFDTVTFNDDGLSLEGPGLIEFLRGHERAITALERLDGAVFEALPDLQVIAKYGVGLDMIDMRAMNAHGVRLGWTGGVNKRSVSELVICTAISLLRHVQAAGREVARGGWRQHQGRFLSGRCVGIIGCGHIGKDLAILLNAFGCRVMAHDVVDFPEFYETHHVKKTGLEDLLKSSDIVTVHLPLDDSTRHILSAERLALMKSDAILINTARGGVVDGAALKSMLVEGRLGGAAFDVFAGEPPEDKELLGLDNFIVTPHIGGSAEEAILAMGRAAIRGLTENDIPGPDMWNKS